MGQEQSLASDRKLKANLVRVTGFSKASKFQLALKSCRASSTAEKIAAFALGVVLKAKLTAW